LFADGFFYIHAFAIDLMVAFEDGLVNGVIIVKFNKSEATRFTSVFFSQAGDSCNFTKLFKILSNVILGHVLFQASHKYLFNGLSSLWFTKFFPRSCPFGLNRLPIDGMGSSVLTGIDLLVLGKSNEAKTSRPAAKP